MGKPKGDNTRLKSRPSSSSQAASLVHSATTTLGFGGYSGTRRIDSPLSTDDTFLLTDVDSDLSLHLRRLGKKDPTTKLKALASLSTLLNQKSGNDAISILPQWVFEYKRLLLDYNRDVRRATNDTMTNLVIAVGRDLAPHLKSLMGAWWFAQFDPVPEVSRAAKKSLQAAFPLSEKRLDALMLYVYDIFVYFEDNLKLTPNIMSDMTAASDEIEEMHQHVISSSLFALATCLDIVCMHGETSHFKNVISIPKYAFKAKETVICLSEKIFADHKYFMNLLISQTVRIRLATYSVLRSYIENVPSAFKDGNIRKIATNILGTFKEKDTSCHAAMWDTVILFSKTYPDMWTDTNVQKPALNNFFSFIRSGFFGSQLISYTKLLPFLSCLPKILVTEGSFCFNFFENLWGGRISPSLLNEEILEFFVVYKECFLWTLCDASRYFTENDVKSSFKVMLVSDILVRVLWNDFLSYSYSEGNENSSISKESDEPEEDIGILHEEIIETKASKYSSVYLESLGKCIVDVLSTISSLEEDLLLIFCTQFQEDCMNLFQKIFLKRTVSDDTERVIKFLLLLDKHAVKKGNVWPFDRLVGPLLSKAFPFVKSHVMVEAVHIFSVTVSIFGSRKFVEKIHPNYEGQLQNISGEFTNEQFLLIFKDLFIPWCLDEYKCSTGRARLDLLFQLVEEDCFSEQWDMIITYVKNMRSLHVESASLDFVDLLAFILEKAGEENCHLIAENSSECQQGFILGKWHHAYIDSTAIFVINSSYVKDSYKRFMRAVMGGLTEDSKTSFLSRNVVILTFQAISDIMLSFISKSPFSSFREFASSLLVGDNISLVNCETGETISKMASFVSEALCGSHFLLNAFREDDELILGISAALFIIEWEYSILCEETNVDIDSRFAVCEAMHSVHKKINKNLFKSIDFRCRERIGDLLFRFIWSFISKKVEKIPDNVVSIYSFWTIEVLEILCQNQSEEQNLLDLFFSSCSIWPLWTIPNFSGKRVAAVKDENLTNVNENVVCNIGAVINMLISKIGFDRVVLGSIASLATNVELESGMVPPGTGCPRAWLAAEMLCLSNWKVGFISGSVLPSIILYSKRVKFAADDPFLYPLVKILVDGSLIPSESSCEKLTFMDIWTTSYEDFMHIEAPFPRALFSLLLELFRDDNTWKSEEACVLFELLLSKLYIGEDVDIKFFKLLPPLMTILVQPLCCRRDDAGEIIMGSISNCFEDTQIHVVLLKWMSNVSKFPPLSSWKTERDNMAEWYNLVLAFYPLRFSGNKVMKGREISPHERKLLFELFQKERGHGSPSLSTVSQTCQKPTLVLLPKLISATVAYCGDDFGEEEWDFVFLNTRYWIEKSVLLIEKFTENANSSLQIPEFSISSSFVQYITISRYGLDLFSLICEFMVRNRAERWESFQARVHESVLRILLCVGAIEAPFCILEVTRFCDRRFLGSVSSVVVRSTLHARERAVKSFTLWGRKRGPVGSLYTTLFSYEPPSSPPVLRVAAFVILSTEPVLNAAVVRDSVFLTGSTEGGNMVCDVREELSSAIRNLPSQTSHSDFSVSKEELNFLLGWSLLISFIFYLPAGAIKQKIIAYIEEDVDLGFLDVVIRYIPLELCTAQCFRKEGVIPGGLKEAAEGAKSAIETGSLLLAVHSLWPTGKQEMSTLCGALYGFMLRVLPAYVRNWFSRLRDQSVSSAVEIFTKSWCSPLLIADEFLQIKKSKRLVEEGFFVSMSKTANEVVATYTKDETKMDLVIQLPPSYPLRTVVVDCRKGLGISEAKRRKWFMFMSSFVRNQNGALAEAIQMWKRNIDREFEGVEECPICYSVVHSAIDSIPRLTCKTCKHKFHSPCLYKWFSTSHKSTCPLCQSPF